MAKASAAPTPFDPNAFGVADADPSELVGKRGSKYDDHAWTPILAESYEEDKGKAFDPVPADQLDNVKRDLNGVARALGIGVKIRAHDNGDGTFRVAFTGQPRRVVNRQPLTQEQKDKRNATRAANKASS